jgi:hypothetical protein
MHRCLHLLTRCWLVIDNALLAGTVCYLCALINCVGRGVLCGGWRALNSLSRVMWQQLCAAPAATDRLVRAAAPCFMAQSARIC